MKQAVLCYTKKRICVIAATVICAVVAALFLFACGNGDGSEIETTVPSQDSQIKFSVTYTAGDGGTIDGKAEQKVSKGISAKPVKAVADFGYEFIGWSDGVQTAARRDLKVSEDISVTAIFEILYFDMSYAVSGNGSITGETEQSLTVFDTTTEVVAVPDEGYRFVGWSDGVGTAARTDKNVFRNKTVTAQFIVYEPRISYTVEEGGHIVGEATQVVDFESDADEVMAVADAGYNFVGWSDGKTEPTRKDTNVTEDFSVRAIFEKKLYKVTYVLADDTHGHIEGETEQYVRHGEDSAPVRIITDDNYCYELSTHILNASINGLFEKNVTEDRTIIVTVKYRNPPYFMYWTIGAFLGTVETKKLSDTEFYHKAVPKDGYAFLGWSDGVETAERYDEIFEDYKVAAIFGYVGQYKVYKNTGGRIDGEQWQAVIENGDFTTVRAVPDDGYMFAGWSDTKAEPERRDVDITQNLEVYALFEPVERTFTYDYGIADGGAYAETVKIKRDALGDTDFVMPTLDGYDFIGWYADRDFKTKVVSAEGMYMLGNYGFTLDTDTLYARWEKENADRKKTHYILMPVIERIEATMYSKTDECDIFIERRLTGVERLFYAEIISAFRRILNAWFEDRGITFEVDGYFMTTVADEQYSDDNRSASIYASYIPELIPIIEQYNYTITSVSLGRYKKSFDYALAGVADYADACIFFDYIRYNYDISRIEAIRNADPFGLDRLDKAYDILGVYFHEFAHTVEYTSSAGGIEIFEYHEIFRLEYEDEGQIERCADGRIEATRRYLRRELEFDGEKIGVSDEIWNHEYWIWRGCYCPLVDYYFGGDILLCDGKGLTRTEISVNIMYGDSFCVEAIPRAGYRFVKWSDGVMTARRSVDSVMRPYGRQMIAIFEKIT